MPDTIAPGDGGENRMMPVFSGEILVCDDSPMHQGLICEHLARLGLKAVIAVNGRQGVDLVKERLETGGKLFDMVFMDIYMPVMDGLEAASAIAGLNTGTPVIAMTANIMDNSPDVYARCGISDCINKPFASRELRQLLLKHLTPKNQSASDTGSSLKSDDLLHSQLLSDFLKFNRTRYAELLTAVELCDLPLAHRIIHSLKGNAAQIGKNALAAAAADAEKLLKEGKPLTEKHLDLIMTEFNAVIIEIEAIAGQNGCTESIIDLTPAQSLELAEKLEPLLESGNPECLDHIPMLRGVPGTDGLIRLMENYSFEAALRSLIELKHNWE